MSYYQDALKEYLPRAANAEEKEMIATLVRRLDSVRRENVVPDDPRANQGFVQIERVNTHKPAHLFGQSIPSFSHNRISFFFGEDDGNGGRRPGKLIMSALLTDESLSQLVFSPNRENDHIALTAENYLEQEMPAWDNWGKSADDELEEKIVGMIGSDRQRFDGIVEQLRSYDRKIPKKDIQDIISSLRLLFGGGMTSNIKYYLKLHAERLQRDLVKYRSEMTSTALNLNGILKSLAKDEPALLENNSAATEYDFEELRNSNPLFSLAASRFTREEALFMGRILQDYLIARLQMDEPDKEIDRDKIGNDKYVRSLVAWNNPNTDTYQKIARSISGMLNPYVNQSRDLAHPLQLTASCTHISGGEHDLHATFPSGRAGFFALRIHAAQVDDREDNSAMPTRVRAMETLIEIGTTTEDLMMILRGHPSGEPLPCSIDRVAGHRIERAPAYDPISQAIRETAEKAGGMGDGNDLTQSINVLANRLKELIESGAGTVGARKEMDAILTELEDHFDDFSEIPASHIRSGAQQMNSEVDKVARQALEGIKEYMEEEYPDQLQRFTGLLEQKL